jgi:hypothetical protein
MGLVVQASALLCEIDGHEYVGLLAPQAPVMPPIIGH